MTTITTRASKGSPLSWAEADANFTNLNTDKLEVSSNLSDLASASTARTNLGLGNVDNTSDINKPVSTATQTAINTATATAISDHTALADPHTQYLRESVAAASGGSALIGYTAGVTGAVARTVEAKQKETISVKDFGAVGDGVTDEYVKLQQAIDSVKTRTFTSTGGPSGVTPIVYGVKPLLVNVPSVTFGTSLLIDGNIEINGLSGNNGTILTYSGAGKAVVVNSTATDYPTAPQLAQSVTFRGLHVQAYAGSHGVFVGAATLRDVNFYGGSISGVTAGTGVELSNAAYGCEFDGFDIYGCAIGLHFNNYGDIITVRNGWFGGNSVAAIMAEGPTFNIENNNIEGNSGIGIQLLHRAGNANGLRAGRIVGNRFGDEYSPHIPNSRDIEFTVIPGAGVSNISGTVIADNKFFTGGATPKSSPIVISGPVSELKIRGNFKSAAYTSGYLVTATPDAYSAYTGYDCYVDDITQVSPNARALFSRCDNRDFQRFYGSGTIFSGFPVVAGSSGDGRATVTTLSTPLTTGDTATQKRVLGVADYTEVVSGRPVWVRSKGAVIPVELTYSAANDGAPIYLGYGALSFTAPSGKEPYVVGQQVGGSGAVVQMLVLVG